MGLQNEPETFSSRGLVMGVAHPDDAFALAPSLRPVDKKELHLGWEGSDDTGTLLSTCIDVSDVSYSISDDSGAIHGLWGHGKWAGGPTFEGLGYIWLLSDEALFTKHASSGSSPTRRCSPSTPSL